MKKLLLVTTAILALSIPAAFAADQAGHDHSKHAAMGGPAHEEVIAGVKATFTVQTMADAIPRSGPRSSSPLL